MEGFIYPNEAELQWSILIVLYPFITGLVAGAFIVSSLYHVFEVKALRPVARFSLLTALAFLLVAPLPLQAHLGHPERAFEIFLRPNFSSAMAGFGYIWLGYLILVVIETWLVFRADIVAMAQQSRGPKALLYRALALESYDVSPQALQTDARVIKLLAAIGIPMAALLHGYVGFIFGAIKANPWWSTPLMPVIFLMSAIVSGIALLLVMYVVISWLTGRATDTECVRMLARLLFGALIIDLALEGLELLSMSYEQEESWETVRILITQRIAFSYIGIQAILGSLIPLAILFIPVHRWPTRSFPLPLIVLAATLVVIGIFAMRFNVVVGGQLISKSLRGFVEYRPVWGGREGIFFAGLLLMLPFYIFTVLSYLLPPWRPEPAAESTEPEPPADEHERAPAWALERRPEEDTVEFGLR